jgi:membrane-bound serine protease (ClpP class)
MLRNLGLMILGVSLAGLALAEAVPTEPEIEPASKRVVVVPIKGEINGITARAVTQRFERAKREKVDIIVIRLDTPGGLLKPALDISKAIKAAENIRTVAYVDRQAYSAGALIALACNEIVIKDQGRIGDCAPIIMGGKLEGAEREKAESPVRAEFRDSARRNGYNELLAQSMVSYTIGVYKIQNRQGEIRYVDEREAKQISDYDSPGSTRGQKDWKYIKTVVGSNELLTMTEIEAEEYGFAKAIVQNDGDVQKYLGVSNWELWKWDWGESIVGFLNSMAMTGILMAVGMLALYVALNTPGFGVPEVVAISCFAIVFGSKYMAGIAEWWTIALFVIGVVLLLVELLVLPGFGVAGIAGGICVLIGLLGMVMPKDPGPFPFPRTPIAWDTFWGYTAWLTVGFFIFVVGVILLAKYLPRIPKFGRLVLAEATSATAVDAARPPDIAVGIKVGQVGRAIGPLHPAGQVRIGEKTVDVVTEGEMIDAGSEVQIVSREGNRIVVRARV